MMLRKHCLLSVIWRTTTGKRATPTERSMGEQTMGPLFATRVNPCLMARRPTTQQWQRPHPSRRAPRSTRVLSPAPRVRNACSRALCPSICIRCIRGTTYRGSTFIQILGISVAEPFAKNTGGTQAQLIAPAPQGVCHAENAIDVSRSRD